MRKQKKIYQNSSGITLIALVISIIVMLILAGVSINAIVGDNGVLTKTTYASFLSEMSAVEEAVQLWKAGEIIEAQGDEVKAIPANGLCNANDLTSAERLVGEVGYYRVWSLTSTMPSIDILSSADNFNSSFESELVFYPAGVQDLYYLNNDALEIKGNKTYLIDATTGMIYSMTGISLKGVRCYSLNMAKAVMNGTIEQPLFAEAEVSGTGSGEKFAGNVQDEFLPDGTPNPDYNPYGFQIIADSQNNNVYKLYNNGDLYAKGVKGNLLNTSSADIDKIDSTLWRELEIPSILGNYSKIIPGTGCVYVIDNDGYLWAWGNNNDNKFGLTQEQQVDYTGREAIKLNIDGKKVYKVFPTPQATYVITDTFELYAAGYNTSGNLGIGDQESHDGFVKCIGIDHPENIVSIESSCNYTYGMLYVCQENDNYVTYFSGYNRGFFKSGVEEYFTNITQIFNGEFGDDIYQNIKQIKFFGDTDIMILTKDDELLLAGAPNWQSEIEGIVKYGNIRKMTATTFGEIDSNPLNIVKISGGCNYNNTVIERINSSGEYELWVHSSFGDYLGLEESTLSNLVNVTPYLPNNLKVEDIKSIRVASENIFLIMKDGNVFAGGTYGGLGLGPSTSTNPIGFICLQDVTNTLSYKLPNIKDVYYWNNQETMIPLSTMFLEGQDGKIYVTGNSTVMFGDNILEKSWKKIASNVKSFSANTQKSSLAYVDKNKDLWVLGNNSLMLGIGATSQTSIKNFVKVKDYLTGEDYENISGKVEDVKIAQDSLTILTTDGKLFVTGITKRSTWPTYLCIGLPSSIESESGEKTELPIYNHFVPVLENVVYFNAKEFHHFAITKEDDIYKFWAWGVSDGGLGTGEKSLEIPTEQTDLPFDVSKVKKIVISRKVDYIITTDGYIYTTGSNHITGGICGLGYATYHWEELDLSYFNNEKVVDVEMCASYTTTTAVVTEKGNLYVFGRDRYMGIGSTSTSALTYTPIKVNGISNVKAVAGGNGFFVITKNDGSVWGTGSNTYGILGRWIGIDRKQPNSRYKTAFEWVECPELEI